MAGLLRVSASSNWKPVFAVVMLALPVIIGGADLIAPNDKTQAAGTAQGRVYRVRERHLLNKVIKVEDIQNLDSPEFPKGYIIGQPYPNNRKIGLGSPKELKFPGLIVPTGFTAKLSPKDSLLRR